MWAITSVTALCCLHLAYSGHAGTPPQGKPSLEVLSVLQKVERAYGSIKSARIETLLTVRGPGGTFFATSRISYEAPNKVHATFEMPTDGGGREGVVFVSDGKTIWQKVGSRLRKWPFSLEVIQNDGPPVYIETLALWDSHRQLMTARGLWDSRLSLSKGKWEGRDWIVVVAQQPKEGLYEYYVDPKTYLISRTMLYVTPGDRTQGVEYRVMRFERNAKIAPDTFKPFPDP
jgi:outer membrane lipoprotein-sorting protein